MVHPVYVPNTSTQGYVYFNRYFYPQSPVENVGVPPDIEVEQMPADVIAGPDPQLEKAIRVVLDQLKKNPAQEPKRPPYPVKIKK